MDAPARTGPPDPDSGATLHFLLNGRPEVVRDAPTHRTVLEYLRDSGRPGSKEGCGEGDCGACTVVLRDAAGSEGAAWTAVNACLLPLASLHGRELLTVEGLARNGDLHPVQRSMVAHGGSQCGYCTPGFVMSLFAAYAAGDLAGERADLAVEGNLCRCTGYLPIRRAAHALAGADPQHWSGPAAGGDGAAGEREAPAPDWDAQRLAPSAPRAAWRYRSGDAGFSRPVDVDQALALLAEEDAVPIAGATDLGVEIGKLGRRFPRLVSLEAIPELQVLTRDERGLTIGAALPLSELERYLHGRDDVPAGEALPALREMLRWFAARQIKNRATIGGNLATASPIGDLAPALLALDAVVLTAHPEGPRELELDGFFTGYRRTRLRPGELIRAVRVPRGATGELRLQHALKVGKRGTDDIAIVAGAFDVRLGDDGRVRGARLAYGGVAATPVRAKGVEDWLRGRAWDADTIAGASARLRDAFEPLDDHRGSAAYRRALSGSLFARFAHEAAATSPGEATP